MYGTETINVKASPDKVEHTVYEDRLHELYVELDRLDFQIEILGKRLQKVLPEETAVETKPENIEKLNPVPLIRDIINIRDRVSIIANKLVFLHEHVVI